MTTDELICGVGTCLIIGIVAYVSGLYLFH